MKFKVDENLPQQVCNVLEEAGHQAVAVHHQHLEGAPDNKIIEICKSEERCLITMDRHFEDLLRYPPGTHYGIIVLRLENLSMSYVLHRIQSILSHVSEFSLSGQLWIVEPGRIRIKKRKIKSSRPTWRKK